MPYDDVPSQREEQRSMERESAGRQKSAGASPTRSSGAGGFKSNAAGSGSANSAPAPGTTDGGLSAGVIHNEQQEQNIRDKAIGGGVITNDDLGEARGYLGHFAKDHVLSAGHNAGFQKKGTAPLVQSVAKRGFRKLPGSASPQQGHAQYGTMSEAALGLPAPRHQREADAKLKAAMTRSSKKMMVNDPIPLGNITSAPKAVNAGGGRMPIVNGKNPPTPGDAKMSIRHHEDSIAYNKRHMIDHEREMIKHERELKTVRNSMRTKRGKSR